MYIVKVERALSFKKLKRLRVDLREQQSDFGIPGSFGVRNNHHGICVFGDCELFPRNVLYFKFDFNEIFQVCEIN